THGPQPEGRIDDGPGQQRLPGPERDGAHLDEQLVEQAVVVKLAREVAAPDDPDVLAPGRREHLAVNGPHVAPDEPDVRAGYGVERPGAEDPRRLLVRPRLRPRGVGTDHVAEHPLV